MGKLKTNLRRNLMVMLMAVMVAAITLIPIVAAGQTGIPDIEGFYFAKIPTRGFDLDGVKVTGDYKYVGIWIANVDNTTGVVSGAAWGANTTSVKGARLSANGRTYNATVEGLSWLGRMNLDAGYTTINATAEGTVGIYVPRYCVGEASNGTTGVIDGSPVDLDAGWTTLNVTTAGDIDIWVFMDMEIEPFVEVFGLVGGGSAARFVLFATDIVTDVEDTDEVLVGVDDARVISPDATFEVEQAADGDITIYMPYGTVGNVTANNCTVDGKLAVDLEEGTNVILVEDDLEEDGGFITVNVITLFTIQWSGRVSGSEGRYRLNGAFNWYDVWDNVALSGKLNAKQVDTEWGD